MSLRPFAKLPSEMQNEAVKGYWLLLSKRSLPLLLKRVIDVALSLLLIILLAPVMLCIAAAVRLDSPGGAIFRQTRRGRYNRPFSICKFRTMHRADGEEGPLLTVCGDGRVTRVGRWLRRTRLDELPQLFNVLAGSMSLVGPRPEVGRYVECYTGRQMATLLLRPGVTSPAALVYRDEQQQLCGEDAEDYYKRELLPKKAELNLRYLEEFTPLGDIRLLAATALRMVFP